MDSAHGGSPVRRDRLRVHGKARLDRARAEQGLRQGVLLVTIPYVIPSGRRRWGEEQTRSNGQLT